MQISWNLFGFYIEIFKGDFYNKSIKRRKTQGANHMEKLKLGIDVGGTKVAYALLDADNHIVFRHQTPIHLEIMPEEFTQKMYKEIDEVLEMSGCPLENLVGIAVGMPSYVDYERGYVVTSGSIGNIKNYPARDELQKKYKNVPIVIDTDTNMAAVAESELGAGRGFPHMVYMAVSTGLGTSFIINGELFRGSYGGAGESGHMIITEGKGLTDGCGNPGCFMSYASGSYIVKHAKLAIESGVKSSMADMVDNLDDLTAKHLSEAYKQGDSLAEKLVAQLIHYYALHIYNLFIAFNINCYVCGGGLLKMGDFLLEGIEKELEKFNKQENQKIYIKKYELGGDMGLIGAGLLLDKALNLK